MFEANSIDARKISINDCLYSGNNLNPQTFHLLINFRLHNIGMLVDVEKVFLQISLSEKDTDAVRFFLSLKIHGMGKCLIL